jgi:hypothetical protein
VLKSPYVRKSKRMGEFQENNLEGWVEEGAEVERADETGD